MAVGGDDAVLLADYFEKNNYLIETFLCIQIYQRGAFMEYYVG
jgi:hypothetical protein